MLLCSLGGFAFDGNWCRSMRRVLPTRQAHKRVDNLRFSTLLWITPFPLEGTAAMRELRL